MAVTLSLFAGAGTQFFDNNGVILSGGKIYVYAAGTTTPLACYTSSTGLATHSQPIVLDSAGRVNEIWLTVGQAYKFVLKDSNENLIATYNNVPSAPQPPVVNNASSVYYEEGYTATAGNFVVGATYVITSIGTTNFMSIGAVSNTEGTYFTATGVGTGTGTAKLSQAVSSKLHTYLSILDFGASPSASAAANTTAITAALTAAGVQQCGLYIPGAANAYQVNDQFTVPAGVTVFGDGWSSLIQQTTINKGIFSAGNSNTFRNLRLKVNDGNNTAFVACIYASSVRNLTVEDCYIELGDLGCVGVQIDRVQNSVIRGNRIYGGKWTSGASYAASAADILMYSSGASERHIIEGNFCLSNNSQGIYIDALGYDGDIIISNNICVTLDPATCTLTGLWSLVANGGNRRHGIVIGYNSSSVSGPRCVVDGNICRNTLWTGIYKPGETTGPVIISNNICDMNGYDTASSLSGGIYIAQSGYELIEGNEISRFQNTNTGTGGITVNAASPPSKPCVIRGNTIISSAGYGIILTTYSAGVDVVDNVLTSNASIDIACNATAGDANVAGHNIFGNRITRTSGNTIAAITAVTQNSTKVTKIKNNIIVGNDNTNVSAYNTGIYITSSSIYIEIVGNEIINFYYGMFCSNYYTGGRMTDIIYERNIIKDCNIGFMISGTTSNNTVPLVDNRFINVTTQVTGAPLGGPTVGRIVARLNDKFQWQTTAAPAAGSWDIGDTSVNSAPAIGQPKGWMCTLAGTPGTWVSTGNL